MHNQRGVSLSIILIALFVLAAGAASVYVYVRTQGMQRDAAQMEEPIMERTSAPAAPQDMMAMDLAAPTPAPAPKMVADEQSAAAPVKDEPKAAPTEMNTKQVQDAPSAPAPVQPEPTPSEPVFNGTVLAGNSSPLLSFTQADYDKALASDKLIVLYFYANWCPVCQREAAESLYPAFNDLAGSDVVGFRVNYNDNETEQAERDMARQFGVAYQHTKVFVKDGERILKSPEEWDKSRYATEIGKAL